MNVILKRFIETSYQYMDIVFEMIMLLDHESNSDEKRNNWLV